MMSTVGQPASPSPRRSRANPNAREAGYEDPRAPPPGDQPDRALGYEHGAVEGNCTRQREAARPRPSTWQQATRGVDAIEAPAEQAAMTDPDELIRRYRR